MISYFSLIINISSIKKLMLGALCDQHLVGSYFHFLTETQLQLHNNLDQIKSIFKGQFKIEFNLNEDKYKSMIRYKDNISIINYFKSNGISVIQFQKGTFADQSVTFAVVYWSPSSSSANFVNYILDIVEEYNIKILLGDFNISAFHDTLLNKTTLQRFQIVATEATHRLCKGLIDHVYLRKIFLWKTNKHQIS